MTKICYKCKINKDIREFSKDKTTKTGLRASCRDCQSLTNKQYRLNNQEKVKIRLVKLSEKRRTCPEETMLKRALYRAKAENLDFNLELSDIIIPTMCPILKIPLLISPSKSPTECSPSLDKIIPKLGYIKGNVQVISYKANSMKSNASEEELQLFALWIFSNTKLSERIETLIKDKDDIHKS